MRPPVNYDFSPHYKGDGLNSILLKFELEDGTPIDLSGSTALMQLRTPSFTSRGSIAWEFSTEAIDPNKLLLLGSDGIVTFPEIDVWDLKANEYDYDLQITDTFGFVKTFIKGTWAVNQDITEA